MPTGTCLILITPDSERTMCTFLGTAGKINENDINTNAVKNSHGDKISAEEKKAIENGIADLKKSLEGTDSEDIKKKTQSLIQVSMKLGEAVYKSQQKPEAKEKESKNAKPEDKENVVDADFEDVKDDKEKSA